MVTRLSASERRPATEPRGRRPRAASRKGGAARPAAAPAAERMSKVDTAWLRMDSEHNLMMILGVWTLRPGIAYKDLCRRVEARLVPYSRFHQRVVEDGSGATWIDHPVDVREHVVREKLPRHAAGRAEAALQKRVGELAVVPLDRARPLWQIHLVEDYDGGSALIVRIHHCIADGIALIAVTLSLVDGGSAPPVPRRGASGDGAWLADGIVRPLAGLAMRALDVVTDQAAKSAQRLRDPQQALAGSADLARLGYQVVSDAAALLLMPDDTRTRLKGKPGTRKQVAWCPPLPLEDVKAVGRALQCSINDVLLSCVAGSIGAYLRAEGDDVAGCEIRAMIPVNLRQADDAHELGNHFGLVPLLLPVGIENPVERLAEVRRRMDALKGSTQPLLAFAVLAVAGLMAKPAQDAILNLFGHKTTAVMTNVPGPKEKLKFLGSTLEQTLFWVPQSGDIGLGVSILSYGGGVQFGVMADTLLCPHPERIIGHFAPEFDKLAWLALMLPWGE